MSGDQLPEVPRLRASEAEAATAGSASPGDIATSETRMFSAGRPVDEVEAAARASEHRRNERFRDYFERLALLSVGFAWLIFLVIAIVWFWHLIGPERWTWLDPERFSRLQSFVTGGAIVGIATGHLRKRLGL